MTRLYLITHAHTAADPATDARLWRLSPTGVDQAAVGRRAVVGRRSGCVEQRSQDAPDGRTGVGSARAAGGCGPALRRTQARLV
ncbi:MAG: hypothetical protein R2854_03370 [Caldilineaceae bacterium]